MTFPADENSIVAVQQVLGNAFSALLVPLSHRFKHLHITEFNIRSDYFLLLAVLGSGGIYFCTFNAPLLRLKADNEMKYGEVTKRNGHDSELSKPTMASGMPMSLHRIP